MTRKKILGISVLMVAIAGWLYHTDNMGPRIEAESGMVKGSIKIVKDDNRSGSHYIKSSGSRNGTATYLFHIDRHGIYRIRAKVYGHSDNGNSFYVTIDKRKEITWDMGSFDRVWRGTIMTQRRNPRVIGDTFPVEVELKPGTHTLIIREREPNTGLDYFQFEMVKPVAAASFFSSFHSSDIIPAALALCLIALSVLVIGAVVNAGWLRRRSQMDARLMMLEKRLGDMQDVIISLDDQLKRMEYRFDKSSEPELVEKD